MSGQAPQSSEPELTQGRAAAPLAGGVVHQLSCSAGGVPKIAVPAARVTAFGLEGDQQRYTKVHGGPERALCIFALEVIEHLAAAGHPITPGSCGENVTVVGLPWAEVRPGARLRLGDEVEVEITRYTTPCKTIAGSFADGDFRRISHQRFPGESRVYARVLSCGHLEPGAAVMLLPRAR